MGNHAIRSVLVFHFLDVCLCLIHNSLQFIVDQRLLFLRQRFILADGRLVILQTGFFAKLAKGLLHSLHFRVQHILGNGISLCVGLAADDYRGGIGSLTGRVGRL